ncbi:MAG: hypothetical protein L6R35_006590 [Caloplaca aegaea]|nr:MAG: hypothetical protein L6R35_006590 [Caloplaca aegaea]
MTQMPSSQDSGCSTAITLPERTSYSARSHLSNVSESSSVVYNHEPFDQYALKVKDLCQKLWPLATEDFVIERLPGGSYNRIIGITTPPSASGTEKRYILRVARFDVSQHDRELAIHRYVAQHTSIPLADIVFSDPTNDNPLGSPYVVQSRIPGTSLWLAYHSLTHEQRKSVVQQFATVLLDLQAVKNETSGVVTATAQKDGTWIYNICRYDIRPDFVHDVDDVDHPRDHNVLNMLLIQCQRWLALSLQYDPKDILSLDYYAQLSKIAREMDELGVFEDNTFHLTHLDLEPRNIMVVIGSDKHASISGVLDWDSAIFAPVFTACEVRSWIWTWDDGEVDDEGTANNVPAKPEDCELKRLFEDMMGPVYLKYAYQPQYRMVRSLFLLAKDGLRSSWTIKEAEKLFKEWAEFTDTFDSPDAFIGVVAYNLRETDSDCEEAAASDSPSVSESFERLQMDADSSIDRKDSPDATAAVLGVDKAQLKDEKTAQVKILSKS